MTILYSYDWTGTNGSAWAAEWTTSSANPTGFNVDIQSNQGRLLVPNASQVSRAILASGSFNSTNAEAVVQLVVPSTPANGGTPQLILRASGDWDTENDSPVSGYKVVIFLASNQFALFKRTGGTTTQVGTTQSFTWTASTTFNLAFRTDGTTIAFWAWTGSRPGTATYSQTDSSITSGGRFQMACLSQSAGSKAAIWDNLTLDNLGTAASATVATGTGTAHFESSGGSNSVTITSTDPVSGYGFAFSPGGSARTNLGTPPTATGTANNATTTGSGNTSVTPITATGAGVANAATITRAGNPTPTEATSTGVANSPTISTTTGTVTATAQVATGAGDATGVSYLLDENGDPILDEGGNPIVDTGGLTVKISPTPGVATSAGASNAPSRSIATRINAATSTGTAPQPSITTSSGGAGTTNVNPAPATSTAVAGDGSTLISTNIGAATSSGAAESPQSDVPVQVGLAEAIGTVPAVQAVPISVEPTGVGEALNPQIEVLGNNFISAAAIPIASSAPDVTASIYVYPDALIILAVAHNVSSVDEDIGQLVTLRDEGHTVSLKER